MADYPFSISANEISASDWCGIFGFSVNDEYGILINQVLEALNEEKKTYDLNDIIENINSQIAASDTIKEAVKERFQAAIRWGLFEKEGTKNRGFAYAGLYKHTGYKLIRAFFWRIQP